MARCSVSPEWTWRSVASRPRKRAPNVEHRMRVACPRPPVLRAPLGDFPGVSPPVRDEDDDRDGEDHRGPQASYRSAPFALLAQKWRLHQKPPPYDGVRVCPRPVPGEGLQGDHRRREPSQEGLVEHRRDGDSDAPRRGRGCSPVLLVSCSCPTRVLLVSCSCPTVSRWPNPATFAQVRASPAGWVARGTALGCPDKASGNYRSSGKPGAILSEESARTGQNRVRRLSQKKFSISMQ